jgi:transcriptional regulator with XRE-family HTH domain
MDATDSMKEVASNVNQRIAARVRSLRDAQQLSLEALAAKSGVSRSMISLIERGETSPTAVVLDRLATGLGVTLASLFDPPADLRHTGPVARREDQPEWRDPASGYVRRNVSPPSVPQPMRIVEVHFPPRARVAFENTPRGAPVHQQIWVLEGEMEVTVGGECYRLRAGDCLAMRVDRSTMFHNRTRSAVRYAVVITTETRA